jgi:heme/copper-type cytochrome/quinol oxidase subunit 2
MHLPITNYAIILFVGIFTFLFELLENTEWFIRKYRSQEITDMGQSDYHGDSLLNLIGDTITNLIGIFMAIYISNKYVKWTILGILFGIITVVEPTYWNTFLTVLFFRSM